MPTKEEKRLWTIWVCGCKDKVTPEDWADDIEPITCGHCKEEIRQVRVGEAAEEDGATLIAAERRRQVEQEGWTPAHDDQHTDESLRQAALCYARLELGGGWDVPDDWPWEPQEWKPRDDITCLVKAGALLAAEIDRLQRERLQRIPVPDTEEGT